jgi:hypothetical protein
MRAPINIWLVREGLVISVDQEHGIGTEHFESALAHSCDSSRLYHCAW